MASAKNTLTHAAGLDEKPKRSFNVIHPPPSPTKSDSENNNAAGNSRPSAKNTFRVGVSEDKNRRCRRTMEDTHAYIYNFLPPSPPACMLNSNLCSDGDKTVLYSSLDENAAGDSDNGYFAIFDGHAGTFAADWCGKKLHHLLEDSIRRNKDGKSMPELLDQTFMNVDKELKDLPVKNSGCTAVCAVLRWENRPVESSGSDAVAEASPGSKPQEADAAAVAGNGATTAKATKRVRMLYTANVGDARIVLCRSGKALRLSYDHKGSDENEGKRVANAGGLILNNRVNGVLAVTRALGDSYIKELVTGHPYTTETVIQQDIDEFIILACDGLWDVCSDQEAVDLVRTIQDPQDASKALVDHALARFSTDNLSCMIVRFETPKEPNTAAGVGLGILPQKNASESALVDEDVVMDDAEKKSPSTKMEDGDGK
ncbi:Protein phosphatase 2C 1 [Orbilia brochopaga]|uniref:Protein phosphatase 2C 1 n=1 Tax=Orbilia brochopaga TaxID=3140254 RepID=A0AAV9UX69_9PEZI